MTAGRFQFSLKKGAMLIAACAIFTTIATRPSSRLFLMGTTQNRLKSGNWVNLCDQRPMTESRFEAIVNAVVARGDVDCLRISNPTITDAALVHAGKLKTIYWLLIEDAPITDASLQSIRSLTNLRQLHIDRCPNLSLGAIEQLRKDLPQCSIRVNSFTLANSSLSNGTGNSTSEDLGKRVD